VYLLDHTARALLGAGSARYSRVGRWSHH